MTLLHLPEHEIRTAHEEPGVAHLTFATEAAMNAFLRDNRDAIKTVRTFLRWDVDWQPQLTITAR